MQKKMFTYYKTNSGYIKYNELIVHFENNRPLFAYFEENPYPIYDITLTYDDMVKYLQKNRTQKKRLKEIKDNFLYLLENKPSIGDKIYYYDRSKKYEFIFDGDTYNNNEFPPLRFEDILNYNFKFE